MRKYITITILLSMIYGCQPDKNSHSQPIIPSSPESLGATIGSLCELGGYQGVQVQGHSLVWGLAGTGSNECAPTVRKFLLQYLRKLRPQPYMGPEYAKMSADQLIDSHDTAVVRVSGIVPAGAPRGTRFDVKVFIPWSTQTTSLQGGKLLPTELQVVISGIAARSTAIAGGPIFINPFPQSGDKANVNDPRRGIVLGGGRSMHKRRIQLALLEPDSRLAQQVQKRINSRFQKADGPKIADALNRSLIDITIPEDYKDRYQYFIPLMLSMYLQGSGAFQELKLGELKEMATNPKADFEAIALAWEAIGRNSLWHIKELYDNPNPHTAYYAVATGLNLGDRGAIDRLAKIALDDGHPHQSKAAEALGDVGHDVRAATIMIKLLGHKNSNLRLLAYMGLRKAKDPRIRSVTLPGKFKVETVETDGENLIYVWAVGEGRIVLFGKNITCKDDLFIESADKSFTVNSREGDEQLTITKRLPGEYQFVTAKSSLKLEDVIATMARPIKVGDEKTGAGMTFSQIVGAIYQLCEDEVIPAGFKLNRRRQ